MILKFDFERDGMPLKPIHSMPRPPSPSYVYQWLAILWKFVTYSLRPLHDLAC